MQDWHLVMHALSTAAGTAGLLYTLAFFLVVNVCLLSLMTGTHRYSVTHRYFLLSLMTGSRPSPSRYSAPLRVTPRYSASLLEA
jgi:hypothetical protein